MKKERIILGIDPGTNILGYGIIHAAGSQVKLLDMDVFRLEKLEDPFDKLKEIFNRTVHLIQQHHITEFAVEAPFFGKNVQSMLKLGRAQGVTIAAAVSQNLSVTEYSPRKIKQAITGNGNASKEQVAAMLKHLIPNLTIPKYLDATDGVAAAYCHYNQTQSPLAEGPKDWKSFIKQNPNRLK